MNDVFKSNSNLPFVSMMSILNTYFNAVDSQDTKNHTF